MRNPLTAGSPSYLKTLISPSKKNLNQTTSPQGPYYPHYLWKTLIYIMAIKNQTLATELFLMGFSQDVNTNIVLFLVFFIVPQLHTPMYFFLCILSFLDLSYSSTVMPKLLADLLSTDPTISIGACAIQLGMVLLLSGTECLLLALMAYDRYLAICRPLHYPVLMRWSLCYELTAIMCLVSFILYVLPSLLMPVPLCYPNQVNHFMCEVLAVLSLACDKIYMSELVIFYTSFISLLFPFVFIIASYACIIASVLKIRSTERRKAFSTCTSHISVVVLFFGTGMVMYFGPASMYSSNREKYISIVYVILTPMLNPVIYSLNNRDVKITFRKILSKLAVSSSLGNNM
ncbi:olfactory receptor 1019-like [Hyla sarda]|uniref:olfactory receptor 1019-like n=1 Tax=Hyla sarda TaxID=327740 RepID=UPI0024C2785C|nr:olfactory receptor 1019-like [Hyla sarda]